LLTVDGLQVPEIPFNDVVGKVGAVVPAQKGGIAANTGKKIGFDKKIPVNKLVVQPLMVMAKLE
jgi:hypothetical protein